MDIEDIIGKYLHKSATEEEREYLLQWLGQREENRLRFKKTYDLWLYSHASLADDTEMEAALERLKRRTSSANKKTTIPVYLMYFTRIAASLLLLFSAGYGGYMLRDYKTRGIITYNQLLTGANGKGEYTLPDGSTVWLNTNSMLKYPETFTGGKRLVELEGEALFEVTEDRNNPFFVRTRGMDVEVLGTKFLVNNYPQKTVAETVLVNGSVKIKGDYAPETRLLKPGELFAYNKQTGQTALSKVDTDNYTNWIHSKLVFDNTNLAHVIINLEKWFGVNIVASADLINIHMSFTIRRESLEEVLTYMSLTSPIDYKWEGGALHLSSKK